MKSEAFAPQKPFIDRTQDSSMENDGMIYLRYLKPPYNDPSLSASNEDPPTTDKSKSPNKLAQKRDSNVGHFGSEKNVKKSPYSIFQDHFRQQCGINFVRDDYDLTQMDHDRVYMRPYNQHGEVQQTSITIDDVCSYHRFLKDPRNDPLLSSSATYNRSATDKSKSLSKLALEMRMAGIQDLDFGTVSIQYNYEVLSESDTGEEYDSEDIDVCAGTSNSPIKIPSATNAWRKRAYVNTKIKDVSHDHIYSRPFEKEVEFVHNITDSDETTTGFTPKPAKNRKRKRDLSFEEQESKRIRHNEAEKKRRDEHSRLVKIVKSAIPEIYQPTPMGKRRVSEKTMLRAAFLCVQDYKALLEEMGYCATTTGYAELNDFYSYMRKWQKEVPD